MFPNVGMGELVIVLIIVLLLFGAKRLPEVAKALGKSIKHFKDGMTDSPEPNDKAPDNGERK